MMIAIEYLEIYSETEEVKAMNKLAAIEGKSDGQMAGTEIIETCRGLIKGQSVKTDDSIYSYLKVLAGKHLTDEECRQAAQAFF